MGYLTDYRLHATGFADSEQAELFELRLNKQAEYRFESNLGRNDIRLSLQEAKWYDWQKDLETVSQQFPEVVITVDGTGEESGDIWRAKVQNGKVKVASATITFPELDD